MPYLYVLALEDHCFYVDICENMHSEVLKHQGQTHCPWTTQHKLRYVMSEIFFHENKLEYMQKRMEEMLARFMLEYGVNQVRGPESMQDHAQQYSMQDLPTLNQVIGNVLEMPYDGVRERLVKQFDDMVGKSRRKDKWYRRLWIGFCLQI